MGDAFTLWRIKCVQTLHVISRYELIGMKGISDSFEER